MDQGSQFYEYTLGSKGAEKPFFKEWSPSGSGHPSAYTYGYVKDDGKHLVATIDFTGDNTRDGNKDYAKVYVKTETGLKEFKISEDETTWGTPSFTYTDKVAYQHKVYDFKIPLEELGVTKDKKIKDLELAFAAYGTDSPIGHIYPDLAYDPQTGAYLMVFNDYAGSSVGEIWGRMINADGTPSGNYFPIASNAGYDPPAVAYDSANHVFLVVWNTDNYDIHGRFVNNAGELQGTGSITICNQADDQYGPKVAFDSNPGRFLVAWVDLRGSSENIYGQLVDSTGPVGTATDVNFPLSNTDYAYEPAVASDSANNRFLVTWTDDGDIKGQLVNTDGSPFGSEIPISVSPSAFAKNSAIGYDSINGQFLVVWNDNRYNETSNMDIFGQFVSSAGSLTGSNFDITLANGFQGYPSLAFNSFFNRFLVVWTDYRSGANYDIWGRIIHSGMTREPSPVLDDSEFIITDSSSDFRWPSVAYNSVCRNFLTAFTAVTPSYTADVALAEIGPCVNVPVTQTTTLPAGTTIADYRIVSLGLVPSNLDPTAFIGEQIGTYDPSLMRIAHYENETGTFMEYPFGEGPGYAGPGDAAWFLFRFGKTLRFSGYKTPVEPGPDGLNGFYKEIGPGWNQIGNPLDIEISVESIYVGDPANEPVKMTSGNNQVTQRVFWIWVNGEYVAATTLPPGMGGWLLKKTSGYGFAFFGAVPITRSDVTPPRVNTDGLERPPAPPGYLETSGSSSETEGGGGCFISATDK